MRIEPADRFTPTAVGLVSRAWVKREVARHTSDERLQRRWLDELTSFEPARRHGLRNMFLFWLVAIGASAAAGAVGWPRWTGFLAAVMGFLWLARVLAVRALLWRLAQLKADNGSAD